MGRTGRGGQAADAAWVQADVGARRSRTRVHDRERRPGSAEHARAELVVGRQRGIWRRTAARKRRRRLAKLVAARAAHCLHNERRDCGQYTLDIWTVDRFGANPVAVTTDGARTGIPYGRPMADISISPAVVAAQSICGGSHRRNIREDDRPSRSADHAVTVCCPYHDFGRRDADRLQLDFTQPQYPEARIDPRPAPHAVSRHGSRPDHACGPTPIRLPT